MLVLRFKVYNFIHHTNKLREKTHDHLSTGSKSQHRLSIKMFLQTQDRKELP